MAFCIMVLLIWCISDRFQNATLCLLEWASFLFASFFEYFLDSAEFSKFQKMSFTQTIWFKTKINFNFRGWLTRTSFRSFLNFMLPWIVKNLRRFNHVIRCHCVNHMIHGSCDILAWSLCQRIWFYVTWGKTTFSDICYECSDLIGWWSRIVYLTFISWHV